MIFDVIYNKQPQKFLKKLDKKISLRIIQKIENLCKNPISHESKSIVGYPRMFRLRIGLIRVLYEVSFDLNEITIIKIDKRSKIYK